MATIFVHPLVPVAARLGLGSGIVSRRLLVVAALATILPDLDVIAFSLGIPYDHAFGHRGFSHSLAVAAAFGLLAACFHRWLGVSAFWAFLFVGLSAASHGLLDAFTNGGLGIAFLWPYSEARFFMPWTPIEVSPIGARGFFTARGLEVLKSEAVLLLPALSALTITLAVLRRKLLVRLMDRPPWE